MKLLHSGKVRDVYLDDSGDGDDLVLVASDRISIYDVVLPTPIPDKGAVLTQLSLWWFDRLADLVPHHVLSATDVPPEFAGRALRCRRLDMLPVECIARGYLAGLGLKEYEKNGTVSGVALPPGLVEGSRLPEPIFTPTTKAPVGEHDEFLTFADVEALIGTATAERLRTLTLEVYRRGAELAEARGILVADTKLEFGRDPQGAIVLADEVLTPGLVAVLARRPLGPRRTAVLLRQAVRARLVRGPRLGPHRTRPGDPAGRRRRHARPLHGGLRDAHRGSSRHGAIAVCSTYRSRAASSRRPSSPRSTPAACR